MVHVIVDRENFTGKVVFSVSMDVEGMDVQVAQNNLETLIRERLDRWSNEVHAYECTTELFSS